MLSKKISKILENDVHRGGGAALGSDVSSSSSGVSLANVHKRSTTILYVAAASAFILFIMLCYLLFNNIGDATMVRRIGSITGVGVIGLIYLMLKLSKQATEAGLLLKLSENMPAEDTAAAFRAVLKESSINKHT